MYNVQISKTQYTGKTYCKAQHWVYTFHGVEYNIEISNDQYTSFFRQYTIYIFRCYRALDMPCIHNLLTLFNGFLRYF